MCRNSNKPGIGYIYALFLFSAVSVSFMYAADIEKTRQSDGTVIIFNRVKGIKTIKSSDGKEISVDLNGKTPYGEKISESSRNFYNKNHITASLVFDPLKSDDLLQDEILQFYNALFDSLQKTFSDREVSSEFKIIVSYCRFGEYSFCYKKKHTVSCYLAGEKKTVNLLDFDSLDLKDRKKSEEYISQIVTKAVPASASL